MNKRCFGIFLCLTFTESFLTTTYERPANLLQSIHDNFNQNQYPEFEIIIDTDTFMNGVIQLVGPMTYDQRTLIGNLFKHHFNNSYSKFNASLTNKEFVRELLVLVYPHPFIAHVNNKTGEINVLSNNIAIGNGYQIKLFNQYFKQIKIVDQLMENHLQIPTPAAYISSNITMQVFSSHTDVILPNVMFYETSFYFNRVNTISPSEKHKVEGYIVIGFTAAILLYYVIIQLLRRKHNYKAVVNTKGLFVLFICCFMTNAADGFNTDDICNKAIGLTANVTRKELNIDGTVTNAYINYVSDIAIPDLNNRICIQSEQKSLNTTFLTGIQITGVRHIADVVYEYVTFDPVLHIKYQDKCQHSCCEFHQNTCPSGGCDGASSCQCIGAPQGTCNDANCNDAWVFTISSSAANVRYVKSTQQIQSTDGTTPTTTTDLNKHSETKMNRRLEGLVDKFTPENLWFPNIGYCHNFVRRQSFKPEENECSVSIFDICGGKSREVVGLLLEPNYRDNTNWIFEVYKIIGIKDTIVDFEIDYHFDQMKPPIKEKVSVSYRGSTVENIIYNKYGIRIRMKNIQLSEVSTSLPTSHLVRHIPDYMNRNPVQSTGNLGLFLVDDARPYNSFTNDKGSIGSIQCPRDAYSTTERCVAGTGMIDFLNIPDVPSGNSDSIFNHITKQLNQPLGKAFLNSLDVNHRLPLKDRYGNVLTLESKNNGEIVLKQELSSIRYVDAYIEVDSPVSFPTTSVEVGECGIVKVDGCCLCRSGFIIEFKVKSTGGIGFAQVVNRIPSEEMSITARSIRIDDTLRSYVIYGQSTVPNSKLHLSIQTITANDVVKSCNMNFDVKLHQVDYFNDTTIRTNNTMEEYARGENSGNWFSDLFNSIGNIFSGLLGGLLGSIFRIILLFILGIFLFNLCIKLGTKLFSKII
jgi:hypothetical protein